MNRCDASRPSLRRQLAWMFTTLAIVVAIAQAALVYVTGNRSEEAMIDSIAAAQLRLSMAQYRRDPAYAQPNTPDMFLYVAGEDERASLPEFLQELPEVDGSWELYPQTGIEYHVAAARQDGRWFYLVYDVADHERRQDNVLAILAVSVVVIALLVLAASDRIARRMTGDLERLSLAVRGAGSAAAPGAALRALARHAESADLAQALDDRGHRLQAALARERAFSAAASHELRTPLMQAGSTLELLSADDLTANQRQRVGQLRASLTEITMLTAGLLRVARGTAAQPGVPIDLHELVDEVSAHLQRDARARSIEIRSTVAGGARAAVDRDALWIVLVNLMRNAIRHSGGSSLSIGWDGVALRIRDDGHGFDAARSPLHRHQDAVDGQAGYGAADGLGLGAGLGLGLGLSIVERICEAAGWSLEIDSDARTGTQVVIGLSASARASLPAAQRLPSVQDGARAG